MSFEWEVPVIVAVIVAAALYLSSRPKGEAKEPPGLLTGSELIEQLQRTLGMAILMESVEPAAPGGSTEPPGLDEPVTLRATFMYGRYTTQVAVTGETEAEAWDALARAAIAWRNSDYQHVQMWPGGG